MVAPPIANVGTSKYTLGMPARHEHAQNPSQKLHDLDLHRCASPGWSDCVSLLQRAYCDTEQYVEGQLDFIKRLIYI
jgi:hypothetical protein